MANLIRQPAPQQPAEKPAAEKEKKPTGISADLAAAVEAVTAVPQAGATAAPFITAMQREAVERELRRMRRKRIAWVAAGVLVVLVALHFAITRVFYREPTAEALEAYGHKVTAAVVPLYSTLLQPLQPGAHAITLSERLDQKHVRYAVEVTLRLREPLYGPAITNGTTAYRQLQESLQSARAQELKLKLFAGANAPQPPELPLLIQIYHRAGESLVVRVPFEARRFGWQWRLQPPQLERRAASRTFEGSTLARYANTPYLIFGAASSRAEMRQRMTGARDYIIAVLKEVRKHADSEAVSDAAAEALANRPAADATTGAGLSLANLAAFDPDAVAVELAPVDPNAPAIEQGAPKSNLPPDPGVPAAEVSLPPAAPTPAGPPPKARK